MALSPPQRRTVHFIANCVYSNHLAGGDIHFLHMAEAALRAGYDVHFFGGAALAAHVRKRELTAAITLTDKKPLNLAKVETIAEQLRLLCNYFARFLRTIRLLSRIRHEDVVYAVTDYWVDTWPALLSRAHGKMMSLGMDAPSVDQIIHRTRPDVTKNRLSSIYYFFSQNLSLRLFRRSRQKQVIYVHPTMRARLLGLGFKTDEITFVSNGMDRRIADLVPDQPKEYDVIWIGRLHFQKGINDLIETIQYLKEKVDGFRVVLVGKLEAALRPRLESRGLAGCVTWAGIVSEEEKFRLFKASRLFLMPSRYESWGIVIAEALVCGTPVVAYDLDAYRPIFGNLVSYVPRFDLRRFQEMAEEQILRSRKGKDYLAGHDMSAFREEASWEAAGRRFLSALSRF
jgi:glycosyltransferase involved in cell wall biosynthesis